MAAESAVDRAQVIDAVREVIDPELGYNIVDLGLIYELEVESDIVKITMTMTTPGCPAQDYILSGVHERGMSVPGVSDVQVNLVWLPAWSPRKMSAAAKEHFGIQE